MTVQRCPIKLTDCNVCPRAVEHRTHVVPPKIIPGSQVLVVGEAPGEDEDRLGESPFVGRAGNKLREVITKAGLDYTNVSLANVICCRPVKIEKNKYGKTYAVNDKPSTEEINNCYNNLENVIEVLNPKVIVAAGNFALRRLTGTAQVSARNGMILTNAKYPGKIIIPVLHPAAILRSPGMEDKAVQAFIQVKKVLIGESKIQHGEYTPVLDIDSFRKMMVDLQSSPTVAIDIEASALHDFQRAFIISISFSPRAYRSYILPWRIGTPEFYDAIREDRKQQSCSRIPDVLKFAEAKGIANPGFNFYWEQHPEVCAKLQELFSSKSIIKIFHNAQYDTKILRNKLPHQNFNVELPIRDTSVMHYLLDEMKGTHNLDYLSQHFTTLGSYKSVIDEWIKHDEDTYALIPIDVLLNYNGCDTDATMRLHDLFYPQLEAQLVKDLKGNLMWTRLQLLDKFMMPVQQILADTEEWGVRIDKEKVQQTSKELAKTIDDSSRQLFEVCGVESFNPRSVVQLREILYKKLKFPILKKTDKGSPSTDEETLQILSKQVTHQAPKLLIGLRKLEKLRSTYVDGLLEHIKYDGRIHARFNQITTDTGRLSSSDPNLQNIPRKRKGEVSIKSFFITTSNEWKLVASDYSQIELRVLAVEANDKNAIQMFRDGRDPHREVARKIFNLKADEIETNEQRTVAKGLNFGIPYGSSAQGISERLTNEENVPTTIQQAEQYIESFFSLWSNTRAWLDGVKQFARDNGYVCSRFGRINHLVDIKSDIKSIQEEAERKAINMPIQSLASDLTLCSALKIHDQVLEFGLKDSVHNWAFVHDSIVWEVRADEVSRFITKIVLPGMTGWISGFLGIPFGVDVEVGDNWGEMKHFCQTCGKLVDGKTCEICEKK